ncbi:DJ-1/PfpI family protein [Legionella waltersii]|uniref:ThiJ/PfpI family protein n=1 Tax=Legionella waltersii TaxID=66969 RepID=A0A0W1A0U8_9GAMM|nr:DJ-1/PfpI family protein [Legionella waltersii]KTD74972.1 ThiJ/PfpI family protein [Legionella waltersii]SNV08393.1 ThiJ/PfpI family [Legionella waltersii]
MNLSIAGAKTLGILLFPDFETLDVFGPLQIFGMLPDKMTIAMISQNKGLVKSTHGQSVMSDYDWDNAPHLDYLLVPGGMGTRKEIYHQGLLDWIKARSAQTDITLSVCTGAALLAKAGVLDGHKATSNKRAFNWVTAQSTKVEWIKKARWVDDGKVITSSGISAGIDMSLYVVSRLFGKETRDELAKRAEYNLCIDSSSDPFSVL